jgi:Flp pilus assembly protein TadG
MHSAQRLQAARKPARRRAFRGQAMVEFALLLPVLLLLLVVAIDFGRLFATFVAVNNAAREGAAYAGLHPTQFTSTDSPDPENVTYRARQEVENPSDTRFTAVTVAAPTCNPAPCPTVLGTGGGKTIQVTVSTNFRFFTPIISALLGSSLQLNASATAVVQ